MRLPLTTVRLVACHYCSAGVLPLVCRAFRGLLAGPNAVVWPQLEFHADISTQGGVQRARAFLAWLAAHGSLLRTLHVSCGGDHRCCCHKCFGVLAVGAGAALPTAPLPPPAPLRAARPVEQWRHPTAR